jgi:hypothetical protein
MNISAVARQKMQTRHGEAMNLSMLSSPALAVLLLLATFGVAQAAEVSARLDRNEVVLGETITLTLETRDPQQSLATDLGGLQKDFAVLDQRSETQMSIVNGQQTALVRQRIVLEPLSAGRLVVPSMRFDGGAATPPLEVSVALAPELAPGEMEPVFLELELDPVDGPYYVHAQLSLTVRIFYQQNLTEAAINPPAPQQASVRLLDEVPFQSTRNEVRYRVLERRYAIFPERSGPLEIPPMALTGRLIENPADRLWEPMSRGRRVRVESEALSIEVLHRPADYPGEHWLPARRITLSQQISDAQGLRVGEPVTRTVILDAVGLEENMLEEPGWPPLQHARIYPDQPQGISRDDGKWVLGHKEFRYAVVPEQAGELVLPEIRLHWFDTTSNTAKTAVLPEHRVAVAASGVAPASATGAAASHSPGAGASPAELAALKHWRLSALVLAALWLLTLAYYLRRPDPAERKLPAGPAPDERSALEELRQACLAGDAPRARQGLGRWLRRHGPAGAQGSALEFAGMLEDARLRELIVALEAGGFRADGDSEWDGKTLWQRFSAWLKSRQDPVPDAAPLPDLYAAGKSRRA